MIPSASLKNLSSSYTIVARVDKATSQFLISPDWTVNLAICDAINSLHWPAKEVIKAVKKRMQQKNPKVQLLALTLLETMVKNCGDGVHFQIVERNILKEMIKIVKKKPHSYLVEMEMNVREKILVLLSSWQEAFGGHGGRYPQYYWAYEELRRSGVQFPRHSSDSAVLSAPPLTLRQSYGTRLDEAIETLREKLSLSTINSLWNVLGLLSDMLQAVNPNNCRAVKEEVIVNLVEQCRANKKKLMLLLTTTEDEELLGKGIELNDGLQSALAKHDAIASGSPLPTQVTKLTIEKDSRSKAVEARNDKQEPVAISFSSLVPVTNQLVEEEDDFSQLAKRHSKMPCMSSGTSQGVISPNTSSSSATSAPLSNALVLVPETPAPVKNTNNQDMIDFLSITMSSGTSQGVISPNTSSSSATSAPLSNALVLVPETPAPVKNTNNQDMIDFLSITLSSPLNHNNPKSSTQSIDQAYPYYSPTPTYPQNQEQVLSNSYVVPWAQPQPRFPSGYPPPKWAATPGYYCSQNTTSYTPLQGTARQLQHVNTFPARESNVVPASAGHTKPFVPSYRLFEDLNVLGSASAGFKRSNMSPSQSLVGGGRK